MILLLELVLYPIYVAAALAAVVVREAWGWIVRPRGRRVR